MDRLISPIAVLTLTLLAPPASGAPPEQLEEQRPAITAGSFRGDGSWKPRGAGRKPAQRWSVTITRNDGGEITGLVAVAKSPLLANGNLRARLVGTQVSGTISRPDGGEVVRFWGVLQGRRLRGEYLDLSGESGEWTWEGPLPE